MAASSWVLPDSYNLSQSVISRLWSHHQQTGNVTDLVLSRCPSEPDYAHLCVNDAWNLILTYIFILYVIVTQLFSSLWTESCVLVKRDRAELEDDSQLARVLPLARNKVCMWTRRQQHVSKRCYTAGWTKGKAIFWVHGDFERSCWNASVRQVFTFAASGPLTLAAACALETSAPNFIALFPYGVAVFCVVWQCFFWLVMTSNKGSMNKESSHFSCVLNCPDLSLSLSQSLSHTRACTHTQAHTWSQVYPNSIF